MNASFLLALAVLFGCAEDADLPDDFLVDRLAACIETTDSDALRAVGSDLRYLASVPSEGDLRFLFEEEVGAISLPNEREGSMRDFTEDLAQLVDMALAARTSP